MKNLIVLFVLSIFLFPACANDDDGGGENLGDPGDLVIEISWDAADADFDLAIIGPNGLIAGGGFISNTSLTGLTSSPDVLNGPGVETIRFDNSAEDGSYFVAIDLVTADAARDVELKIGSSGTNRTFNENMVEDQTINYSFTKAGGTLNF